MVGPIQTRRIQAGTALTTTPTSKRSDESALEPWLRAPEATLEPARRTRVESAVRKMGEVYAQLAADDVSATEWMQPMEEAWLGLTRPEQAVAKHEWMQALLRPGANTDAVRNERLFMRTLFADDYEALVKAAVDLVPETADAPLPDALQQASTRFVRDVADELYSQRLGTQREEGHDDRKNEVSAPAVTYRTQRAHLMGLLEARALGGDDVPIADLLHNAHIFGGRGRGPEQTQRQSDERSAMRVLAKTVRHLHEVPDGKTRWGSPKTRIEVELSKGRKVPFDRLYGRGILDDDKSWTQDRSRLLLGAEAIEAGAASPAFRRMMDKACGVSRDDVLYEPAMLRAVLDRDAAKVAPELAGAARILDRTLEALDASLARGPVSARQMKDAAAMIPREAKGLPFSKLGPAAIRVRRWVAEGLGQHPDPTGALAMIETLAKLSEGLTRYQQMQVGRCLMEAIHEIEDHIGPDHAPALEHVVSTLIEGQQDAGIAGHHLGRLDGTRVGAEGRKERVADGLLQAHDRRMKAGLAAEAPDRAGASRAMRAGFYLRESMKLDLPDRPRAIATAWKIMGAPYVSERPERLESLRDLVGDDVRALLEESGPRATVGAAMVFSALGKQFRSGDTDVITEQLVRANASLEGLDDPTTNLAYAAQAWALLEHTAGLQRGPLFGEARGVRFEPDMIRDLAAQVPEARAGLSDPAAGGAELGRGLALLDALQAALPKKHAARERLEGVKAEALDGQRPAAERARALDAALTQALDALDPPPVLDDRVELLGDLAGLLWEVTEVAGFDVTRPLADFAKTPTEAMRAAAASAARALSEAVARAHAAGELPADSLAHDVARLAEQLVAAAFGGAEASAATRDAAEGKLDELGGPRRGRFGGLDEEEGEAPRRPDGTHLDVAIGKLAFADGKIRPMQVMVGRDDIARDLRAVGESVARRPDAEVEAAQVEALEKGARLLEGLEQVLPGRNSILGAIVKDGLPGIRAALHATEAGDPAARAHRELALGQLETLLSEGYGTFGVSKDRPRSIEYAVRYGVSDALVELREHLAAKPKQLPELGTFATGRLLGRLQVLMHALPSGHPVKADLRAKLDRVRADVADGRLMDAYAHLEPAASATLGLTADPKVEEKLAKVGLAAQGPVRVPMSEVRAGDVIRYREDGGREVHGWVEEVKAQSLLVHHLSGGQTILGFQQIEGQAADRFADYGAIMRQFIADGAKVGQKIRVSVPQGWSDEEITGAIAELGDRALTLSTEQGELTLPYARISPHVWLKAE